MNQKKIYALMIGTSLFGCAVPVPKEEIVEHHGESKVLYIPQECTEIVSLESAPIWQLTCKDKKGKEFHYTAMYRSSQWTKYEIIRR